ncbi:MAG: MBL fold metallo-hydrolase [Lachnobacterium sp.]|nr:MBL fold metallo-hydrolase [Lachnobacterium sp.]
MKITVLVENTTKKGMTTEHGLSLYIETMGKKILFDSGQSDLFKKNAKELGVDLSQVDFMILSHGHYDHGGGISEFIKINNKAPIYANENVFGEYYNGTEKYIGLNPELKKSNRFIFTQGITEVAEGMTLYDSIGRKKLIDMGASGLNKKIYLLENSNDKLNDDSKNSCANNSGDISKNGLVTKFESDDFCHEHYLMIEENSKKILISGCSHNGIINIVEWFKPDILVGGFHFMKKDLDSTLKGYAETLNSYNTSYYTCHCTGQEQYDFMKKYMNRLNYIATGDEIFL